MTSRDDDWTRKTILARRARFIAASMMGVGMLGCGGRETSAPDLVEAADARTSDASSSSEAIDGPNDGSDAVVTDAAADVEADGEDSLRDAVEDPFSEIGPIPCIIMIRP